MTNPPNRTTAEQFWDFLCRPENDDRRFELVDGRIIEVGLARPIDSVVGAMTVAIIGNEDKESEAGYTFSAGAGYALDEYNVRLLSAGWLRRERISSLKDENFVPGAPEIAVQVAASPAAIPTIHKAAHFIRHGTQIFWAIFPDEREVQQFRPAADGITLTILGEDDALDAENILPGLHHPVADLFANLPEQKTALPEQPPGDHYVISYSPLDGGEFAMRLHDALEAAGIPAWLDTRDFSGGYARDVAVENAIRECAGLLFVMTPDSVVDSSVCYTEWTRALDYRKLVIPLRLSREAEAPFRLHQRQYIDFAADFDAGLEALLSHLRWRETPEGQLQEKRDLLRELQRDLRRARTPDEQERIQAEIGRLREAIGRGTADNS
jgi:Uma2 family endonuclease